MWLPPDNYELWLLAWRRRLVIGCACGVALAVVLGVLMR